MAKIQMQQEASQEQGGTPRQFTPEEVVEILTEAVNLSSQYVSLEQLEAIADEAGIPRETLHQAIQKRLERTTREVQTITQKQLRRRERWRRFKRWMFITLLGGTIFFTGLWMGYESAPSTVRVYTASTMANDYDLYNDLVSDYYLFENLSEQLVKRLAIHEIRGKRLRLYILPPMSSFALSSPIASIWMGTDSNSALKPIYKTGGRIVRASLSPNEQLLAFVVEGSRDAGVWVMDLQTNECHRIISGAGTDGYGLLIQQNPPKYATIYGREIAWLDDNTLLFSTTNGRYKCELNARGVPLQFAPFDKK